MTFVAPASDRRALSSREKNERTFARQHAPRPGRRGADVLGERVSWVVLGGPGGSAQPLVGVHGLGSDARDLVAVARRAGCSAVLVDLPGFGRSARVDRAYPVARAAAAVLALLDQVGLARPVWLGCSYGAHVALRAALDCPARVAGLVLVAPGGLDPQPPPGLRAAFAEEALAARSAADVARACDALVARPGPLTARFRARRLAAHAAGDHRAVARSAQGALDDDAPRHLARVAAPVELVAGARDPLVPLAVVEAAAARLARRDGAATRLTVLQDVGHMPWLEAPEAVAACVRRATRRPGA